MIIRIPLRSKECKSLSVQELENAKEKQINGALTSSAHIDHNPFKQKLEKCQKNLNSSTSLDPSWNFEQCREGERAVGMLLDHLWLLAVSLYSLQNSVASRCLMVPNRPF